MKSDRIGGSIMDIDVFISYHTASSLAVVEAVVNKLESVGVRCWYAPRDVVGAYASSIIQAINACKIFLLMLNKPSSESPQVLNELNAVTDRLSAKENVSIVPFHLADSDKEISPEAQYYVRRMHWIDAITPPLDERIEELVQKVLHLLNRQSEEGVTSVAVSAHTLAKSEYRLQSDIPQARLVFDGRDDLLEEISSHFEGGDRILFLEGVGGIGKSEVAKQYALRNRVDYDHILFVTYAGSLKKLVCDPIGIVIENLEQKPGETEDEFFARKWNVFQSLADEKTLLIVDNFDVEDDPDLEFFQGGRHRVIFTTRNRHDSAPTVHVTAIEDEDTLFRIFEEYYGAPVEDEDRPHLWELFKLIEYHTYTIELLAKQMDASFLTGRELLELFKKGKLQSGVSETVAGRAGHKTAFDHICAVFSTSGLTNEEKQVLRQLSLVGLGGVPAKWFKDWAELDSFEVINHLEKKSWVRRERGRERRLNLHPLVVEVVHTVLTPNLDNCGEFIERIADFSYSAWFRPFAENQSVSDCIVSVLQYFAPFECGKTECFDAMSNYLWQVIRFDDAIHYSELVYQSCMTLYGEASMATGFVAKTVAGCYYNSGRVRESAPWYKRGLECMLLCGEVMEDLALAYERVGRCYEWEFDRDLEKAEEYIKKALEIRLELEAALDRGEKKTAWRKRQPYNRERAHMCTGGTYLEMGRLYQISGEFAKALECAETYRQYTGYSETNDPSNFALVCLDKGICHYHLGLQAGQDGDEAAARVQWEKAVQHLEKGLQINIDMRGNTSIDTIDTREHLADTYVVLGRTAEADKEYEAVKAALEIVFGVDYARIQDVAKKQSALQK